MGLTSQNMWRRYWAQERAKEQAVITPEPTPVKEDKPTPVVSEPVVEQPQPEQKEQEQPTKQKKSKE